MSAINLRENKEPRISGQHFVCGRFGSSLGQLICFCGDGEIAQAHAIGVHTMDHCELLHHHSTSKGNLNFMVLLNVNITLKSTHEMQGACILQFMTTKYRGLPRNLGVHTMDHCELLHHHSTSKGNLNFMMLLNVNITLKSTHEMRGACILPFMTTKFEFYDAIECQYHLEVHT